MSTFELRDFHLFDLLQFVVALPVFIQQPAVVLALDLVLVLQLVILLLQVFMLVLTKIKKTTLSSYGLWFVISLHRLEFVCMKGL